MRKTAIAVGALMLGATLSACGGGDGDSSSGGSYCDQLEDAKQSVEDVDFTALDDQSFEDLQSQFQDLQDAAPDEVKGDWETLTGALDEFQQAFEDAGITLDDLQGLQEGQLPEGVDLQALQDLGTKLQDFNADNSFNDAAEAIRQNAQDECGIDLNEGTDGSSDEGGDSTN